MTGRTDLTGHDDVLLQDRAAGQARLRADYVVLTDHTGVADLAETIDFGTTFDARFTEAGAIHRGESLNFHVVLNYGNSRLQNLVLPAIRRFCKSEAIAADNDTVVQGDTIPDAAVLA